MSYKYQYDESGLASSYLGFSFIFPLALYFLYKYLHKQKVTRVNCKCKSCKNISDRESVSQVVILIVLWTILAVLLKNMISIKMEIKRDFDPLKILDVALDTPKKSLRRKVVKLMRKYDVDRAPEDKKKEYEEKLTNISKAYNILKNDKKFSQWLSNDSKTGEIMAIPDVIMKNATLAFIFYCIILGMCLPNFAYRKWRKFKTKNPLGINFETMECFINYFNDNLKKKNDIKNLLIIISKSNDFNSRVFLSDIKRVKTTVEYNFGYPLPDIKTVNAGYFVLIDHLFRLNICSQSDLEFARKTSLKLIEGMKCVAFSKGYIELLKKIFALQSLITQGVFEEDYFYLQYPHIKFVDLFNLKVNNQKIDIQDLFSKLLQGNEYRDAVTVHNNIRKLKIKEFTASVKNTGNFETEISDVEENLQDEIINTDKINNKDTYKIPKSSLVTIKVRLDIINKSERNEAVHTYNIKNQSKSEWTVFISIDNVLHKEMIIFKEDDPKDINFTFNASSSKNTSEIKLYVLNGQYLKNNLEDAISIKYY